MAAGTKKSVSVGVISILSVYIVLMMAVFAVLSYTSANADYKLSQRAATSVYNYYTADCVAEQALAKMAINVRRAGENWKQAVEQSGFVPEQVSLTMFKACGEYPVDEWRNLVIEVLLPLDELGLPTGEMLRNVWKSVPIEQ